MNLQGVILGALGLAALMSLAMACLLAWLGWRRVTKGDTRRALAVSNALALVFLGNAGMWALGDVRSLVDGWLALLVFCSGPALAGYSLGTTLALLRGQGR